MNSLRDALQAPDSGRETDVVKTEGRRVAALRMEMAEAHPFWGYLLLQVRLVAAPDLPTLAATDCVRHIWYNPHLTRLLSSTQLGFVLAHEIVHQLQAVHERMEQRDPDIWNQALDYVANRLVLAIPRPGRRKTWYRSNSMYELPVVELPDGTRLLPLHDPAFDGMVGEAVYDRLLAAWTGGAGQTVDLVVPMPGDNGNLRLPVRNHGGGVDLHWPHKLDAEDRRELTERIAAAREVWRRDGRRGDMPADEWRPFDPTPRAPVVPWQRIFRQIAGPLVSRDDYSLARPNRRYLSDGIVVPGLAGDGVSTAVVAIDTSGSIDPEDLRVFANEVQWLHRQVDDLWLLVADAEVRLACSGDEALRILEKGELPGGGGTDHRPVFAWICEHRLQPDVFVGLTDLETEFPPVPPSYPVVWVVPPAAGRDDEAIPAQAPWGHVIQFPGGNK